MLRLLLLPLVLVAGCWPGSGVPSPGPGKCNSDGTCQVNAGESAADCPGDCKPCRAIQVHVNGVESPSGLLALQALNDGKTISLDGNTTVEIQIGLEIFEDAAGGHEFTLHGTVQSASTVTLNGAGCFLTAPDQGGYQVQAKANTWTTVGFWARTVQGGPGGGVSPGTTPFHLCGAVKRAKYLRLVPQIGARGQLDYLTADSCNPP